MDLIPSDEVPTPFSEITSFGDLDGWDWLDEVPEEQWLVPPWHEIQPEERLTREETELLRSVIQRRKPDLLPLLDQLGVRVQRPSQRESLRAQLRYEMIESGYTDDRDWNAYGRRLADLQEGTAHI